jgi:tetratricopeptide (TPR) repeat protein
LCFRTFSFANRPVTTATGDDAFLRIDYPTAVAAYESLLQESPRDPEILWRLARVYVCMGEVAGEKERVALYNIAVSYARRCIQADSTRSEGHTWLAGALGYVALYGGLSEQVALSHELKSEVDRALAINPDDDIACSIKGSFYRALGNVGWVKRQLAGIFVGSVPEGGYEESEASLKRAIAIAPGVMRHHYELAVLYLDWDRTAEAKKILENAATLPIKTAIDRPRLAKIKELLKSLEDVPDHP